MTILCSHDWGTCRTYAGTYRCGLTREEHESAWGQGRVFKGLGAHEYDGQCKVTVLESGRCLYGHLHVVKDY